MKDYDGPSYSRPLSPKREIWNTPEERAAGIDTKLKIAARRFLCPNCGKEFSLFQSRAVACKYCPKANQNCPNVRCPYCDSEFPISGFIVPDKEDARTMNNYTTDVFNRWTESYNRR